MKDKVAWKSTKGCDIKCCSEAGREATRRYGEYVSKLLSHLDYNAVGEAVDLLLDARGRDSTIFFAGNGGSAATASHFCQDLGEAGRKAGARPFRTICLGDSVSSMTALANDYGYEKIFVGQLENLFRKGDVLVAISASGNSPNVVEAVKWVKRMGGTAICLVGFDGGILKKIGDHVIHVATEKDAYGPVEDIHLVLDHMMTSYLISSGVLRVDERKAR